MSSSNEEFSEALDEVERMVDEAEFTAQEGVRYVQLEGDPSTMDISELRRQLGYTPPEEPS
jgi:hypothetical protein